MDAYEKWSCILFCNFTRTDSEQWKSEYMSGVKMTQRLIVKSVRKSEKKTKKKTDSCKS